MLEADVPLRPSIVIDSLFTKNMHNEFIITCHVTQRPCTAIMDYLSIEIRLGYSIKSYFYGFSVRGLTISLFLLHYRLIESKFMLFKYLLFAGYKM